MNASLRRIGAAVLVVLFGVLYAASFRTLIAYWAGNDMYSFAFLVPLISIYFVFLRREHLRTVPVNPSYTWGTLVLASGLSMLIVGRISSTNLLEWLSLPLAVWGLCLLVLGSRMTQSMAFPIAYLFAMVPFWEFLTARLHPTFQLYSAITGVAGVRLFDIPVVREGVFIHLPTITLEVADICSGVNQLVAILCIGVPVAHFHVKRWSKRAFIVLAAVLIALLSNGLRVAIISLFAYYGIRGPDGDIHGPYSVLRTIVISGIGFLVLFWLIARFADPIPQPSYVSSEPRLIPDRRVPLRAAASAIILLTAALAFDRWHVVQPVPPNAVILGFPTAVGPWRFLGDASFGPAARALGFDYTLSRRYRSPDGRELELLIGYFALQRQGHELVGFELSRLLSVESGPWVHPLGDTGRVKDFLTTVEGHRYHVTYWYVLNGRIAADDYRAKWWTTWDSLTRRRSNGGLVLVRSKIDRGESLEECRSHIRGFIEPMVLASKHYIPRADGS